MGTIKVRAGSSTSGSLSHQIDHTDKAILRALQRDASLSNVALAVKVHLSAPACLRRVERLKQLGLITGIVALLNPRALDAGMLMIIGVVLDRSTPDSFADFETAAARVSGCMECHAGDSDRGPDAVAVHEPEVRHDSSAEALRYLEEGHARGKVVLTVE
jgi:DNA-binding Lrp family transcriptional regulator